MHLSELIQLFCGVTEAEIQQMDDDAFGDAATRALWRRDLVIDLISQGVQKALAELLGD